ncbi:G2/M phase-specific E3 ubiquitin-protein ligase-like [Oreochromis aureus]|uniref:G2/M phase-specific E3 ubiquitin-protein ligase-like n=1 Tax=Oreochromis aureus TaxID=47969 RepID=UPI001952D1BE|nr:G2/M phase-specific E3 ubiquitin-protein ligase-like [Oreochromis aureus]
MEYRKKKNEERQKFSCGKMGLKKTAKTKVQINIGLMSKKKDGLRPHRGKSIALRIDPDSSATSLLSEAVKKMRDFNKDLSDGPFLLLYPDATEVINIPGTNSPFTLGAYKAEIGKPYQRITLFICIKSDFEEAAEMSDSDSEVVVRRPTEFELADTLPWEPQDESSPLPKVAENEDTDVQAHEIIADLALAIDHKKVSRFNISRSDVWDGAVRGFRRSTYSDNNDLFIKFNDDAGCFEEGLDMGGPRREFLTLLMSHLRNRPIFDGPPDRRYLVYNSRAAMEVEYFLAGKMIAVSIVNGGPAPHFLSKNLVNRMIGDPSFSATIDDVKDEEIGKVLHQVLEAESDEVLQNLILQNSTIFQTAGCLRSVKTSEKQGFVEEYLKWYIIEKNESAIQRFKDGLDSLHFFTAVQQYPSVLAPLLYMTYKTLTASDMENIFRPSLSPAGSNRRQKEALTLGFWADYLLDCEEKVTAVSLEELLMFATGLTALPPAGMIPPPCLEFSSDSPFPVANTCANALKLPVSESYRVFKANMDFGIQNSPGFGNF